MCASVYADAGRPSISWKARPFSIQLLSSAASMKAIANGLGRSRKANEIRSEANRKITKSDRTSAVSLPAKRRRIWMRPSMAITPFLFLPHGAADRVRHPDRAAAARLIDAGVDRAAHLHRQADKHRDHCGDGHPQCNLCAHARSADYRAPTTRELKFTRSENANV